MKNLSYWKYFIIISLLLLICSCGTDPIADQIEGTISVNIDGETVNVEPYHMAQMWYNRTEESHRLKLVGNIPELGEDRYFSLGIDALDFVVFEEGSPTPVSDVWFIDYDIDVGSTWEDYISVGQNFKNPSPEFTFDNIEILFEKISDTRLIGEVTLSFDNEGEQTHHVINFNFKNDTGMDGALIGRSHTPGGGDGGDGGNGGNGGNGGGSSTNCDIANYNGPEFDVQIDSQCKAAYMYDCLGDTAARDAACKIYYEYGNAVWTGSGSLPNCPYCD